MKSIFQRIEDIANTRGANAKKDLLAGYLNEEPLLFRVFMLAYNPYIKFFTKKPPAVRTPKGEGFDELYQLDEALSLLQNHIASREITGNDAKGYLEDLFNWTSEEDQAVLRRVILHNLKCGISRNSFNTVCDRLGKAHKKIPAFSVLLAKAYTPSALHGLTKPYIAQLKSDGARAAAQVIDGNVRYYTREGNEYLMNVPHIDAVLRDIADHFGGDVVVDGELIQVDEGGVCNRQKSNGIANRAIAGTISDEQCRKMRFYIWDVISTEEFEAEKSDVPYHARLQDRLKAVPGLEGMSIAFGSSVEISPTWFLDTEEEVESLAELLIDDGEEGLVVKSYDLMWANKRTDQMLKLKDEKECDLIVTGWTHGDKDKGFAEGIGTLQCESSCGNLKVSVYSGLSNAQRGYVSDGNGGFVFDPSYDLDQFTGEIVKVTYNTKIQREGETTWSLFSPRIAELPRKDKSEADEEASIK